MGAADAAPSHLPRPGPEPRVPISSPSPASAPRPGSVLPEMSDEELLAELSAAARRGGPAPNRGMRVQLVAGALHQRRTLVPPGLLDLLLGHGDVFFRSVGAYLIALAADPPAERLRDLVADDDPGVRYSAVLPASQLASRHPVALEALGSATSDPVARVRRFAIERAARLVGSFPELRSALVTALRDPDPEVRRYAEASVEHLGDEGARHALEALAAGRSGEWFVRAVVRGELTMEALELELPPEILALFVMELRGAVEEDPGVLDGLRLPYWELLGPTLRAGEYDAWESLFVVAVLDGESGFVADCARSRNLTTEQRRAASDAVLAKAETRRIGLDVAEELILDHTTPQALRLALANDLGSSRLPSRAREILARVAASDPDPEVRKEARSELD